MRMRIGLLGWVVLLSLFAGSSAAKADNWCDLPEGTAGKPGLLTIAEYGAFPSRAYCPDRSQDLGVSFAYPGKDLSIVLRFEADEGYLASSKARRPITASLRKSNANRTVSGFLSIGNDTIDVAAAQREAELKGGYFDWRFRVGFNTIIRPGIYTLTLRQGGEAICLANGACQIVLDIKRGSP